jgi:hypothetical protein
MATNTLLAGAVPASATALGARELIITLFPDDYVQYEGTAAQLVAEGLIPEDFEWPRAAADRRWEANGFDCWLRRTRPAGHKGPMRSWLEMDNWFIRVAVTGRDGQWVTRRRLERKVEELRAMERRCTAAGSAEWRANWERYLAAGSDKKFQSFKAMIPGLIPPKRGRKPEATAQGAQA